MQAKVGFEDLADFLTRLPVTASSIEILKMKIRTKSYIEKLLPEPQPNSESRRLSGLMNNASAPILQNPPCCTLAYYLIALFSSFFLISHLA
jgi:hypothetical protein